MPNTGIIDSVRFGVEKPASRELLASSTAPVGSSIKQIRPDIPGLTKFETKCLLVQIGEFESNTNSNFVGVGVPAIGIYKANINANTLVSVSGTYFANIATVTITNNDHNDIKIGMVANTIGSSTGAFGLNSTVVSKSVGGITTAANIVPGYTYTITSVGTTDFTLIGANASVVGNVFVANAVGTGTGTALATNNEIILASNHTISGDISFTVSPLKLGKYQNSQWLLYQQGYVDAAGQWTGKDGIDSNELFLSAPFVQENIMNTFFAEKYVDLIKSNAIRNEDTTDKIAGMLAVAYQYQDLGNPQLKENILNTDGTINKQNFSIGSKANVWRETGQTVDSQGRPGHIYFNNGRYAIKTLGADVPE